MLPNRTGAVRFLIWTLWGALALFVVLVVWVATSIIRSLRNDPGGIQMKREVIDKLRDDIRDRQKRSRDFS